VVQDDVLGALARGHLSEQPGVCQALRNGQEMIAGELAEFADEAGGARGEEELYPRVAPRVEEYLPGAG
jgi:hypothetical protein